MAESKLHKVPEMPIDPATGLIDWDNIGRYDRAIKRDIGTEIPDIYYASASKMFWAQNSRREWIELSESAIRRMLKAAGLSADTVAGQRLSQVEAQLMKIQLENDIAYAGPLAGFDSGLEFIMGKLVLVTRGYKLPNVNSALKTKFPVLERFLSGLVGEEQLPYLLGWL